MKPTTARDHILFIKHVPEIDHVMKNLLRNAISLSGVLVIILVLSLSCNKEDDPQSGNAAFHVFLKTSASYKSTYESVYLDIQKVSIHTSTDSAETTGWFELEFTPGLFDLLDYAAGNDTLLAFDSVLQVQTISQVRLVLGNNNSVVKDGQSYALKTPSGQSSGIKVQIHAELQSEKSYKVILDFDADQSVLETGNGNFKLKPVIEASVIEE